MTVQESDIQQKVAYVYALVPPFADISLPSGWETELRLVGTGEIKAIVEADVDLKHLQQNDNLLMQAVVHHDQVIRELFTQVDVLPLRFGMGFRSLDDLMQHLQENGASYRDKLQALANKAEFVIRCEPKFVEAESVSSDVTGKNYFLAKKQQYQAQQDQQQQQQDELKALQAAIAHLYPQNQIAEPREGVERIYLLSDRQALLRLEKHLGEWQAQCPHWELSIDGGLPPYHFIE